MQQTDHHSRVRIEVDRLNKPMINAALSVYKRGTDLSRKPDIVFIGESGEDAGGLSREYFATALRSMTSETVDGLPLFEGAEDHIVPCFNPMLASMGYFRYVGMLIAPGNAAWSTDPHGSCWSRTRPPLSWTM